MSSSSSLPRISYTQTTEIPRSPTLQAFLKAVEGGQQPVAYKLADDEMFPAFDKWNEHYFSTCQIKVDAHKCTTGRNFDIVGSSILQLAISAIKRNITLGQYVQSMERHRRQNNEKGIENNPIGSLVLSGTEMYMRHNYVDREPWKELVTDMGDYQRIIPVDKEDIRTLGFWISGGGMSTQMHFDNEGEHNMNYQIRGRKLITMYSPEDGIQNLYPLPGRGAALSLVDPYNPNLKKFPRLVNTKPHVIELHAGEVLFIPSRWWHDVRHLDDWNINVTAWFQKGKWKVRDKFEGPWFVVTWGDTIVAWLYIAKILVVKLLVSILLTYDAICQSVLHRMPSKSKSGKKL